jgi:hypothetical protein
MRQELDEVNRNEIPISNNCIDELNRVSLPENWWSSQNSYEMFSKKNVKIVNINGVKSANRTEIDFPGWNIKKGDFTGEFASENRILTKQEKEKMEKLALFGYLVFAAALIILISYGIAETIRW